VYGESDDVGITDDERDVLEASPHVSIVRISDAGHFTLNQQPEEIAKLVLEAVTSTVPR
jgi:pimeloyl-ACP methyl ester carboxylesterase